MELIPLRPSPVAPGRLFDTCSHMVSLALNLGARPRLTPVFAIAQQIEDFVDPSTVTFEEEPQW